MISLVEMLHLLITTLDKVLLVFLYESGGLTIADLQNMSVLLRSLTMFPTEDAGWVDFSHKFKIFKLFFPVQCL